MKSLLFVVLTLCIACPVFAQLPAPNADGVTAGHHIFRAKDVDAANKFWTTLGGEPAALATIKVMKFPGVLLFISAPRGANPAPSLGGNHGTTVEFITFKVKDLKATLAKLNEAGISSKHEYSGTTVVGPDEVQVHLIEDKTLTTPIVSDGLFMNVANAEEVSAWYAKWFGAKLSKTRVQEWPIVGEIPGARIVFHVTKDPIAPTKGHSLALLGFEVSDLKAFVQRYQDAGGKLDSMIATATAANLSVVQLTDPWGTSIEVSQGLKAVR
jgi:predicted enzyme related to lactoylglutathione lyase